MKISPISNQNSYSKALQPSFGAKFSDSTYNLLAYAKSKGMDTNNLEKLMKDNKAESIHCDGYFESTDDDVFLGLYRVYTLNPNKELYKGPIKKTLFKNYQYPEEVSPSLINRLEKVLKNTANQNEDKKALLEKKRINVAKRIAIRNELIAKYGEPAPAPVHKGPCWDWNNDCSDNDYDW